jgi:hypothetical protein
MCVGSFEEQVKEWCIRLRSTQRNGREEVEVEERTYIRDAE